MKRLLTMVFLLGLTPGYTQAETVQLFQPGKSSFEWLLSDHEGGKSIRKGMSCQQCHDATDKELFKSSLPVEVTFSQTDTHHQIRLAWLSRGNKADVSLMLDNDTVTTFQKTGCWASCHGDMTGMEKDMGLPKYLGASRNKLTRSGGGRDYKADAELTALMAKGDYVELWHAKLTGSDVAGLDQQSLLKEPQAVETQNISVGSSQEAGKQQVTFSFPKDGPIAGKKLAADSRLTMGIAIHQESSGYQHWVSLPLTIKSSDGKLSFVEN